MAKRFKRFIALWTALVALTCLCAGAAAYAAIDAWSTRTGNPGGEWMVLLVLIAAPLSWLCRYVFRWMMAGGISSWR